MTLKKHDLAGARRLMRELADKAAGVAGNDLIKRAVSAGYIDGKALRDAMDTLRRLSTTMDQLTGD